MSRDSARSIREFAEDAARLTIEDFRDRHGSVFLIRALLDGPLTPAPAPGDRDSPKTTRRLNVLDLDLSRRYPDPEATYVYALGALHQPVSVGRAANNDVCIDDTTLSAMHAELRLGADGQVYVTDKGSTNGTRVGEQTAPFAEDLAVPFGKALSFGGVKLTALPVEQFVDLVVVVTR